MPIPMTAWTVGGVVFIEVFRTLCGSFDPLIAFALSLAVMLVMKN